MEHLNKVEIIGNVGTVRTQKVGEDTVQNFSVCTEFIRKNKDNTISCEATWHQVAAWNKPTVEKGMTIHVKGRTRNSRYTSADGAERIFTEIIANELKIYKKEEKQ